MASDSRRLLFHSCNYGAPHSPWVICILHFLSQGNNAAIVGTLQRLANVGQNNVRWFPMHQRQPTITRIKSRPEYSSWVYSAIRSQLACAANVSPIHLTVRFTVWKCVIPFHVPGHVFKMFYLFNNESHNYMTHHKCTFTRMFNYICNGICTFISLSCECLTVFNATKCNTLRYHTTGTFTQTSFHSVVTVMIYYPSLGFEVQHDDCRNRTL